MSERPNPTPDNLDQFPEVKSELLHEAQTDEEKRQIEQTFDPSNPDTLSVLTDREYSDSLTGKEHEQEFDQLYPALDKVFERLGMAPGQDTPEQAQPTAEKQPNRPEFLSYWIKTAETATDPALERISLENQRRVEGLERKLLSGKATPEEAWDWYLSLGAQNSLEGAEGYLVNAARVASRVEADNKFASDIKLAAACMLYEASIVNEQSQNETSDPERQIQLERAAQAVLMQLAKESSEQFTKTSNPEAFTTLLNARLYLHDLSTRQFARTASSSQRNTEQVNHGKLRLREELAGLANLVTNARDSIDPRVLAGLRSELAIQSLLEEAILDNNFWGIIECRKAFPREDYPNDRLKRLGLPLQSFDVVLTSISYADEESDHKEYTPYALQIKTTGDPNDHYGKDVKMLNLSDIDTKFGYNVMSALRLRESGQVRSLTRELLSSQAFSHGVGLEARELLATK